MRGEYQHTIDAKGRIVLPAKFREELGSAFVITKGLDECLTVRSMDVWDAFERKIAEQPSAKSRKLRRFFLAPAVTCEPDAQGKVQIPQSLREFAGFQKEVTVIGMDNCVELWDTARWRAYNSDIDSDELAETMEELEL